MRINCNWQVDGLPILGITTDQEDKEVRKKQFAISLRLSNISGADTVFKVNSNCFRLRKIWPIELSQRRPIVPKPVSATFNGSENL